MERVALGWGMPHSQGFMQDWTGSCHHDTLAIWGLQRPGPVEATEAKVINYEKLGHSWGHC